MSKRPRTSATRHKLGIRHKWLQDYRCRKHGHRANQSVSVRMISGAYWPICDRCGYAVPVEQTVAEQRAYIRGYDDATRLAHGEPQPDTEQER